MIPKSTLPNSADKYGRCPLPKTHRRLAEVRLVTWRDKVVARLRVPVQTPPSLILQDPQVHDLLEKYQATSGEAKDAAIAIERRWSTESLGDLEVLEALAKVYGLLSDVV